MAKEKMTPREVAHNVLSTLLGEVLTITEAIVPSVEQDLVVLYNGGTTSNYTYNNSTPSRQNTQREAVKDLVRSAFNRAQENAAKWIN